MQSKETQTINNNAMPRGTSIILWINLAIIVNCVASLFFMPHGIAQGALPTYITWTLLGGLLFCELVLLCKWRKAWALCRAILYVVALLQALNLLILSRYFLTWSGAVAMLITLVTIVYLIGVRGYLNSESFKGWFST